MQFDQMKRREFKSLLGGAVAARGASAIRSAPRSLSSQSRLNIDLGHLEVLCLGRDGLPAVLDSFSHFPHINGRFIYRVYSAGTATAAEPISSRNCEHFPRGALSSIAQYRNSLLRWLGTSENGLMNAVQSRPHRTSAHPSENAHYQPRFSFFVRRTEHFPLPLQRSELCRMAERRT